MVEMASLLVSSPAAITTVQNTYREDFSHKSVAQELMQNTLDENQKADISIRRNLILLEVKGKNSQDIQSIERKISKGIDYAKLCFHNKTERLRLSENRESGAKKQGRGFLLMFCLGWDVVTLKSKNRLLIAAIKV